MEISGGEEACRQGGRMRGVVQGAAFAAVLAVGMILTGWAPRAAAGAHEAALQVTLADSLQDAPPGAGTARRPDPIRSLDTVQAAAGPQYDAGAVRQFFLGDDYRDLWQAPLDVPVIDLDRTAGGLTPLDIGGGLQTTMLFLEGADGHAYILRSVDKDGARVLPEGFQGTLVADVARDQISSLNPYGAFIVADLARAAGVLSTAPRLVVVPDDPRVGPLAGQLALFERKVDGNQSETARFGYSEAVVDFETLRARVAADPGSRVDERAFARARLFDMFVGDRDRHDGQWFWATYEEAGGTRFVPLPIDRDFAFARFDGLLLRLARKTGNLDARKLTYFDGDIDDLLGLNHQGAKLDLRFTSRLTRRDWVEIADSLRAALTDRVIEDAVGAWPPAVYEEVGPFVTEALKERRDALPEVAAAYYEMLARNVDVVGTDQPERFEVHRLDDETAEVTVYGAGPEAPVRYRRTFRTDETEEVRLYGLGGDDRFVVRGDVAEGIQVRALGGPGADTFTDRSRVAGVGRQDHFYDSDAGDRWAPGTEARVHRGADTTDYRYALHRFELTRTWPVVALDYDSDNGLFLGGGIRVRKPGFMKEPYAARHVVAGNYAPRSQTFNLRYEGHFVDVWRGWEAGLDAEVRAVDNFRSFYGLGNETPGTEAARRRYQARMQWATAHPVLYRRLGERTRFRIGPRLAYARVEPPEGWEEADPRSAFTPEQFRDRYIAGLRSSLVVDRRDSLLYPGAGWRWAAEVGLHAGLRSADVRFVRLASEVSTYLQADLPGRPTLALRVGGATNLGDFAFFQSNTLGGQENLRGFPDGRFAGRSSVYANAELRVRLMDFSVYVTRGDLGLLAFFDNGRVWADGEDSDVWHQGYGGGLWIAPYRRLIVTGTVGFSDERTLYDLSVGFLF